MEARPASSIIAPPSESRSTGHQGCPVWGSFSPSGFSGVSGVSGSSGSSGPSGVSGSSGSSGS